MNNKRYMIKKRQKIEDDNRDSIRVYCKYCGHTNTIPAFIDYKICRWCKNKIVNDTKAHFMRKVRLMSGGNNNDL